MQETKKPIGNPMIILREEFDDWAILYDPDTAEGYGINPVGVFIWKLLDGRHTIKEIAEELRKNCSDVPEDVEEHVDQFIKELEERGLVGYDLQ